MNKKYRIEFDTDQRTILLLALDLMEGMTAESVKAAELREDYDTVTAYNARRQEIVDMASIVRSAPAIDGREVTLGDYIAHFGGTT